MVYLQLEVVFLNNENLKRRAFRLRRSIDSAQNNEQKQRLIKDYVKTIWKIQS